MKLCSSNFFELLNKNFIKKYQFARFKKKIIWNEVSDKYYNLWKISKFYLVILKSAFPNFVVFASNSNSATLKKLAKNKTTFVPLRQCQSKG